jgi:hypothetical protein
MQNVLQISFHGIEPSAAVEARIRDRATCLERFDDRIMSCHVAVQAPPGHHRRRRFYDVHILIDVPGEKLVVNRSGLRNEGGNDGHLAVIDAFRAAERLLEDHVRRFEPRMYALALPGRISSVPARRH